MTKVPESLKIEESTKQRVQEYAFVVRRSKNSVYNELIEKGLQLTTARIKEDPREKIYNFELEILGNSIVSYAPVEMFKNTTAQLFSATEIEEIRKEFRALDAREVYNQVINNEITLQSLKEYLISKI